IYRDVERVIGHRIAHRDHMRRPVAVGGREMADPAMIEKTALCTGKHCAILPDAGPVAYRFGGIVRYREMRQETRMAETAVALSPETVLAQMKQNGVTDIVWLPGSETNWLYLLIQAERALR